MRAALLLLAIGLAACTARPLSEAERAYSAAILGPTLDPDEVRVVKGAVVGLLPARFKPRPRTTCRETLRPDLPAGTPMRFPAFALGPRVYYTADFFQADFLSAYPSSLPLVQAMRNQPSGAS